MDLVRSETRRSRKSLHNQHTADIDELSMSRSDSHLMGVRLTSYPTGPTTCQHTLLLKAAAPKYPTQGQKKVTHQNSTTRPQR